MPDPAAEPQRPITIEPASHRRRVGLTLACAVVVGAVVALVLYPLLTAPMSSVPWIVEALGTVGVLLAVYGMTRWWWAKPTRALRDLIEAAHAGDAPIEAISDVRHGPRVLVPVIQDLLRELREQRRDLATLHEEIRQRVAQRTDALERTIGTLRHQATRDALTGLFNRRFLDTYLPQVVRRSTKHINDVAVVMADLDHFKSLNDTLGHAAGDELLRSVGQIIRSTVRGEDVPFRVGGDEFLVIIPGGTIAQARALGERVASLVEALGRTYKLSKRPRLSFGVACLTGSPERSAAALMSLADKALYDCKRSRQGSAGGAANGVREPLQVDGSSLQCPAQ